MKQTTVSQCLSEMLSEMPEALVELPHKERCVAMASVFIDQWNETNQSERMDLAMRFLLLSAETLSVIVEMEPTIVSFLTTHPDQGPFASPTAT